MWSPDSVDLSSLARFQCSVNYLSFSMHGYVSWQLLGLVLLLFCSCVLIVHILILNVITEANKMMMTINGYNELLAQISDS